MTSSNLCAGIEWLDRDDHIDTALECLRNIRIDTALESVASMRESLLDF
jgi:hypothetical protein